MPSTVRLTVVVSCSKRKGTLTKYLLAARSSERATWGRVGGQNGLAARPQYPLANFVNNSRTNHIQLFVKSLHPEDFTIR